MAHEVESMFYAGETPWHGLGKAVDGDLGASLALREAGLDWRVSRRELRIDGEVPVEDKVAIVRESDQKYLGTVGDSYGIVQNEECFSFMDELIDGGGVRFHTAGSLKGGRWVFILARMPGGFEPVKGDEVLPFMTLLTSHDGSLALTAFPTDVRVVCANTANAAMKERGSSGVRVKHTSNVDKRLSNAQKVLRAHHVRWDMFKEFADAAARTSVNDDVADEFFEAVEPGDSTRAENKRFQLKTLFERGIGQDVPGVRGTAWALYGACTQYASYEKSTRGGDMPNQQDARFESLLTGSGNKFMNNAVKELRKVIA